MVLLRQHGQPCQLCRNFCRNLLSVTAAMLSRLATLQLFPKAGCAVAASHGRYGCQIHASWPTHANSYALFHQQFSACPRSKKTLRTHNTCSATTIPVLDGLMSVDVSRGGTLSRLLQVPPLPSSPGRAEPPVSTPRHSLRIEMGLIPRLTFNLDIGMERKPAPPGPPLPLA